MGFGDIDKTGYLDRLFIHIHASIYSKTTFEKRGYKVVKGQKVKRQGTKKLI